ncbi:MAG TPA: hypothetical protein VHR17_10670, partial [Thermoanaerobaculia bacterium]|nr:hypothetical protein [Thermoanaerobaculia bacterium]
MRAAVALGVFVAFHATAAWGQESRRFDGELRHLAIDDMDQRTGQLSGRIVPVLDLGNGDLRRLEDPRQLLGGDLSGRVTLTGRPRNGDIVVDDVVDVTPSGERLITVPGGETGNQQTLVVLLNYADRPFEPFSLADVESAVLAGSDSADQFLRESSYGQTWLTPTFLDWQTLPQDIADYEGPLEALGDALELLAPTVDFHAYSRLIFVFESRPPTIEAIGIGSINKFYFYDPEEGSFTASVAWIYSPRAFVFAHELGHNLGLWHASSVSCVPHSLHDPEGAGGACASSWSEYGDIDDTMGSGYRQFSALGKSRLGWLADSQIPIVSSSGEQVLDQVEIASAGVKALRIPIARDDFGSPVHYWVEYRGGMGAFGGTASGGGVVQVRTYRAYTWHAASDGLRPSLNSMRLLGQPEAGAPAGQIFVDVDVGKPFVDPFRGVKIELLERLGAGVDAQARVRVTLPGIEFEPRETIDCGTAPPSSVSRSLAVTNVSDSSRQIGAVTIEGRHSASYSVVANACSARELAPGQSCAIDLRFAPTVAQSNFATLLVGTDHETRPLATASLVGWGDLNPLDPDGNGSRDGLTDALLVLRYLFGFRGAALVDGAIGPGCGRCSAAAIETWLAEVFAEIDIDGNGRVDPLTDGVL